MKKKYENYYLGLDIGTNSVGWAVTDLNYKLLRVNNKNLWGVRLFKEADTAAKRRLQRESGRRLERRKLRIQLLQEIFAPVINPLDANFFMRLEDSNLYEEDKKEKVRFSLFNDANFTDTDYHKKYKTIYHLRKAMLTAEDPDPRLVYLALHHIIKYRGHFLQDWEPSLSNSDKLDDISEPLNAINVYLAEQDIEGELSLNKVEQFRAALLQRCNAKAKNYIECFGVSSNKKLCALLDLIAGKKVKASKIFDSIDEEDCYICFEGDWDSAEGEIRAKLGDDFSLIENAKNIYNYAQMKALIGDHRYISEGMVEKYERHKSDLQKLKNVIKKHFDRQQYLDMFRDANNKTITNYTAYSGKTNFGAKQNGKHVNMQVLSESRSYEDFTKYVRKVLESSQSAMQDPIVQEILQDIKNGQFLPKQVSKNNSTLPYQINWIELDAILTNISRYPRYAFLLEETDGVTTREKILSLLKFRMPYYVGPTNNHSGKYWCVRNSEGKILPWNYQQKIDLQSSEEKFIERMTGNCPYVVGEKVLPKCSLLYEEYVFLNTISSIKFNSALITPAQKQKLSEYYATTGKNKLTKKILKDWLVSENQIAKGEDVVIEGFDDGATVHRRTYYNFCKILGSVAAVEEHRNQIEEIIKYITIAGKEKQNLRKKLTKEYPCFTEEQIGRIIGLTCNGWGRCSSKFLTERYGTNPHTGELKAFSIIEALRTCDGNFMEIYNNSQYGFKSALESSTQHSGEITYKDVDELYCSPAVKKQIWQSLEIVKEIVKVLGCPPQKIFVEVARGIDTKQESRDEKNRSKSRKKQITEALAKLKQENAEYYNEQIEDQFKYEPDQRLNEKKLYLYYLQNGRDIYTGEPIDYNHFDYYDIDHIIPRSKIKDDSLLNNLVLTNGVYNKHVKKDIYPINADVRKQMYGLWSTLKQCGLMTSEKFNRLTRSYDLTEDELAQFINRQIVETQQSTKETIKLLKQVFPSEIVWSKAGNVSDFRNGENGSKNNSVKFNKCREINDLHHAKDAYLNIVVGNTYNVRYNHDARVYISQNLGEARSAAKLFEHDVRNAGCTAWVAGPNGTIAQVQKTLASNAILFTHESFLKKGELFKGTIYPKGENLVPLKGSESANRKFSIMSDTSKYGGYNSESRPYFMLVKYVEVKATKTKTTKTIKYKLLGVTAKDAPMLTTPQARVAYCEKHGLTEAKILIPCIKISTMFQFDGTLLMLSGLTGNSIIMYLAQQFNADSAVVDYTKKVVKAVEKVNTAKRRGASYDVSFGYDGVSKELNMQLYNTYIEALGSSKYAGITTLKNLSAKLDSQQLRQKFSALTLQEQCEILCQIVKSLQCNATLSDLSLLGESKYCGKILVNSSMDSIDNIKIVHRSATGIFEQKIALTDFDKD